jgi:hypothetical protein
MSKFEEYLEAVRKSVNESDDDKDEYGKKYDFETVDDMRALKELPGETDEDKIISAITMSTKWGGWLKSDRDKLKKFGIYYKAEDENEGGMLGFDPEQYPKVNMNTLKTKYLKAIKAEATTKFWKDSETQQELPDGYKGFAWGDPHY